MAWRGVARPDTDVGSEHVVTERLTALPAADLVIQFRPPEEFLPPAAYAAARANGAIPCAVHGRGGSVTSRLALPTAWSRARPGDPTAVGSTRSTGQQRRSDDRHHGLIGLGHRFADPPGGPGVADDEHGDVTGGLDKGLHLGRPRA